MLACPIKPPSGRVHTISLADLQTEKTQNPGLIMIDVRELDEWNEGHLETAIHIPLKSLEFIIARGDFPVDATIVCYCASGRRSAIAGELFLDKGYTNVRNLEGGYQP